MALSRTLERRERNPQDSVTHLETFTIVESRKCVIPVVCMKLGKWYLVKHNCVKIGVFSDYNGQLHVSAFTGHLQVVLGELNLRSYYKHSYAKILL